MLALTYGIAPGENPGCIPGLPRVLRLSTATGSRLTVPGAAHLTVTDAPLHLPPLPVLVGSLDRTAGPRLTAVAAVAFLNITLPGELGDLVATGERQSGVHMAWTRAAVED